MKAPHDIWLYRAKEDGTMETKLFAKDEDVPEPESWADSPEAARGEKKPAKPAKSEKK